MVVGVIKDGRPKSGRVWKTKQTTRSSTKLRQGVMAHLALSFEEKERIRQQKKYVKELEKQMIEERQQEREVLKEKRIAKEKRRLENENKTSVYQNINPAKMKSMNKKQLRLIKKTSVNKHGQVEFVSPYAKKK